MDNKRKSKGTKRKAKEQFHTLVFPFIFFLSSYDLLVSTEEL